MAYSESPRRFPQTGTGRAVVVGVVLVLVAVVGVGWWQLRDTTRTLTALFSQTVGIYPGSDVRILGIKVGEVREVSPQGRTVKVRMTYDDKYRIPADATAVMVPPSLVSDRYIQLTPAYAGGAALRDGAELPVERTAVPLELDDIYRALDELARAVGPEGANATGALADLLAEGADALEGNGDAANETLRNLARALETVSNGRQDLFSTLANLQRFTAALAESDAAVREFNRQLAAVSGQLADERDELGAALRNLSGALAVVAQFLRDNRDELIRNVDALTDLTGVLVRQQQALATIIEVAPVALGNLGLAYNPRSGTIDTRNDLLGPHDAVSFLCTQLVNLVPAREVPQSCFTVAQLMAQLGLPLTDQLKRLLGPLAPFFESTQPPVGPEQGGQPPRPSGEMESGDPTLGGLFPRRRR